MTSYTYLLQTPEALLGKLERELDRLDEDKERASDHAFNFAVTAWHMTDWVWKHEKKKNPGNEKPFSFASVKTFQKSIREQCQDLDICSDLANGSKHLEVERHERTVIDTHVSASASYALSESRLDVNGCGGTPILKVDLSDGSSKRVKEVFEGAVSFWRMFFIKHGILSNQS